MTKLYNKMLDTSAVEKAKLHRDQTNYLYSSNFESLNGTWAEKYNPVVKTKEIKLKQQSEEIPEFNDD